MATGVVGAEGTVADVVTGAGLTVTDAVVEGQPLLTVQPAPVQRAVLVIVVPAGSVVSAVTLNDRCTVAPAGTPAPIVQTMVDPVTTSLQVGVVVADNVPQLAEPAT